MKVFCYASGHIQFGKTVPDGALPIASGPGRALRKLIDATARKGWGDDMPLLVPGVSEAKTHALKLDALHAYSLSLGRPAGIVVETVRRKGEAATPTRAPRRPRLLVAVEPQEPHRDPERNATQSTADAGEPDKPATLPLGQGGADGDAQG